jgi:hypothetical protein
MLLLFARLNKMNSQWLALVIPCLTIVPIAAHLFSGIPAKHRKYLNMLPCISFLTTRLTLPKNSVAYACANLLCVSSISERVRELVVHHKSISAYLVVLISLASSYILQLQKIESILHALTFRLFVRSAPQHC